MRPQRERLFICTVARDTEAAIRCRASGASIVCRLDSNSIPSMSQLSSVRSVQFSFTVSVRLVSDVFAGNLFARKLNFIASLAVSSLSDVFPAVFTLDCYLAS